jgi:hypothetical protein
MGIKRFLEELGLPKQPRSIREISVNPTKLPSILKIKAPVQKQNKSFKEIMEKISGIENELKSLHSYINQRNSKAEVTASQVSKVEAKLHTILTRQQNLLKSHKQITEYITKIEQEKSLCPNCRANVDWSNLTPEENPLGFLFKDLYRKCPSCGYQIRIIKE